MKISRSFARSLALALVLALPLACSDSLTKENVDKVKVGMTVEELHDLLGAPDETKEVGGLKIGGVVDTKATAETWRSGDRTLVVQVVDGKVLLISERKGF
ncbi:MAG: hypothetical protein R3F20_19240 [Planctomycetota bacterium]